MNGLTNDLITLIDAFLHVHCTVILRFFKHKISHIYVINFSHKHSGENINLSAHSQILDLNNAFLEKENGWFHHCDKDVCS